MRVEGFAEFAVDAQGGRRLGKISRVKLGDGWHYDSMKELLKGITVNPRQMGGRPCVRGLRITVANILRLLAAGHARERILLAYPELEPADIDACMRYAAVLADDQELVLEPA